MTYDDKFDKIIRIYRDTSGKLEMTPELEDQVDRWQQIREHIKDYSTDTDSELIHMIRTRFAVSRRTAYTLLNETRRFFAQIEPVNQEFEKILLVNSLKKDIQDARTDKKFKELATLQGTLSKIIGADKPTDPEGGHNTIINLLNYNPTLIGAKEIPNVDMLIEQLKKEDQQRQQDLLDE